MKNFMTDSIHRKEILILLYHHFHFVQEVEPPSKGVEWKWLNLWKGYIQIGVGEFIYIRLGYESEKEPADTDAVVISDCWGSRSAIPTNKEPVKNWVMIYES